MFRGNPLEQFVELSAECADLNYSNYVCGAIRGALFQIRMIVDCAFVQSELKGANVSEIRVRLKEVVPEVNKDDELGARPGPKNLSARFYFVGNERQPKINKINL